MKSIKLLFISFTITLVALITISPANAKPTVKVQHLNVNNMITSKFNRYDIINIAGTLPSNLSDNLSDKYRNNFSTGLFLSNPAIFSEKSAQVTIDIVNKSNDFFTSTLVFNDKLHQLISYFTTPSNENITESTVSTSESKVIKNKCDNSLSFS